MGLRSKRCSHTSWLGRRRDRFRPSRFLTGLTHSPCHQGQLPIGIVVISRIAEAYWQSKFALVGISREWEPRGRLANGNCNHLNLTQSPSRQGRWASASRPMLIGMMGGRFRDNGGSPFACLPSLLGVASERCARRPSARWPNRRVTKVFMRRPCGRSSSPLSAMATGRMAEARSHHERASSALLARSYAHSVHVC